MNWARAAVIAAVACLVAAVTTLVGQPTLGRAAATAAIVAALGVIGVLTTERAKAAFERRDAERRQVATVVYQPGGRIRHVREMSDPVALGIRQAAPGGVLRYVPRDFDPRLRAALS